MNARRTRLESGLGLLGGLVLGAGVSLPGRLLAGPSVEEGFSRAASALAADRPDQAISELEALADRAPPHPDVSYQRGLAYARRARGPSSLPGDLGRAAAGFEEALRLRPEDADAAAALELVRAEVARRRAKLDKKDDLVRPSPDRALLVRVGPRTWGSAAIASSATFSIGLLLRRAVRRSLRVAGTVLAPLSLFALLVLTPAALRSRTILETRRPGVVVAPSASLADENGKLVDAPEVPEASLVEVGERRGDDLLVRYGSYEGWVAARAVRPLLLD